MKTLTISLLTIMFMLIMQTSFACKCRLLKLKDELKQSDYVFSAKVIEVLETDEYSCDINDSIKVGTKVRLQIIKMYKGQTSTETIVVDSEHTNCSYCFRLNQEYLIFGRLKDNVIVTNICRRTKLLKDNKDIKYLERHK